MQRVRALRERKREAAAGEPGVVLVAVECSSLSLPVVLVLSECTAARLWAGGRMDACIVCRAEPHRQHHTAVHRRHQHTTPQAEGIGLRRRMHNRRLCSTG